MKKAFIMLIRIWIGTMVYIGSVWDSLLKRNSLESVPGYCSVSLTMCIPILSWFTAIRRIGLTATWLQGVSLPG